MIRVTIRAGSKVKWEDEIGEVIRSAEFDGIPVTEVAWSDGDVSFVPTEQLQVIQVRRAG